ncbi:MAG: MmgE/PrpD family protein [Deltaproteobacteria bacterium]|nr:MmgE/PrpD family protein [Deltaproteobacteria bacterium]
MAEATLSEKLAQHFISLRLESIPEAVIHATKLHILDSVGVLLAGSHLETGKITYDLALSFGRAGSAAEVTLPGTQGKVSLLDGVMAMASASHCGEMDDIHGGAATCIGAMIVPALLGLGEKHGVDGRTFLEGAIGGYETTVRIGLAINGPSLFGRGWWPSTLCGVFGVALAGATLLRWPVEKAVNALGIAGIHAGGMLTGGGEGSTARHLTFGRSAQTGVLALLATEQGLKGPTRIFEDPRGFCLTLCENPRWDYLERLDDYFLPEVAFKPFPCARQLHAGVEALLYLLDENRVSANEIHAIELGVPRGVAAMIDRPHIMGKRAASLASGQYIMAVTVLRGKLDLDSFGDVFLRGDGVLRLMEKVTVKASTALDSYFPRSWPGRVRIKLIDGRSLAREVLVPKGEKENPMSANEVEQKFRTLAAPVIGEGKTRVLLEQIMKLEKLTSLDDLFSALRPGFA